jgi:cytochrome c551/c552
MSVSLPVVALLIWVGACSTGVHRITENNFKTVKLGKFVEPDFPFISTYLDARNLGDDFPDNNVVSRGMVINLDDSAFVCFDRDLLRWSVAWTGKHLIESMLPQISYNDFFNKLASVPRVAGEPKFANGLYPGWSVGFSGQHDVRKEEHKNEDFKWGALPIEYGRWNGSYVVDKRVVLSYEIAGTNILELPGIARHAGGTVFTRTLEVGSAAKKLFMNVAEIQNGSEAFNDGRIGYVYLHGKKDSVIAVGINGGENGNRIALEINDKRYFSVSFEPSVNSRDAIVSIWRGPAKDLDHFTELVRSTSIAIPSVKKGGKSHWNGEVITVGKMAPDTATFVTDILTLPLPNKWMRNVRVTDLAFTDSETAYVTTFEGDVWRVTGIKGDMNKLSWKRFASGLYEPMSIEVYRGEIYVFGKEGIVRLSDLNGDGEVDYYENFCDLMDQSAESYAWASDMIFSDVHQAIFIAKGGAVASRAGISKKVDKGFRAGSNHDGVIMKISLDGKRAEVYSTGFRAPFLGIHPQTGLISATDQQGNFVSSTPIYLVEKGDFFGVPATAHRRDDPKIKKPLSWIPHRIDRSAGGQIWITDKRLGPLHNSLVHFSFGKPGLFRVLIDSTFAGLQGGVTPIHSEYTTPVLKGVLGPADGQLYMAGFNLLGSSSKGVSAIQRLRYTGKESHMLHHFNAGKQGIILSFDSEMDVKSAKDSSNFYVKRWNYERTEEYGSGHFKSDGVAGEEILPVLGSYLSKDRKKIFLLIPDMKVIDQMEVVFDLKTKEGRKVKDGVWLSVNYVESIDRHLKDFVHVDLNRLNLNQSVISSLIKSDAPITREKGKELFETKGCIGCHSPGTETAGMYGPPFKGLYGSMREMADGKILEANEAYLKESIMEPGKRIVKGYEGEMPSFQGILSESDLEALMLYIMYLKY